jgi:hypothetical protein
VSEGALGDALAAVAGDWSHVTFVAGDPPGGEGWIGVDELLAGPALDRCVEAMLAGEAKGARDVAGSYLSAWLGGILAGPVAAAFRRDGRVWSLAPADLALRPHALGWFDGYAVRRERLRRVDLDSFADELVALLAPVFAAIRSRVPYGLAGMWGSVADALEAGDPALVDALAARVPRLRARPRFQPVHWSGGVHRTLVRGTCCLWYKVYEGEADPAGEGYCTSCPHRSDGSRATRMAAWLEAGEAV